VGSDVLRDTADHLGLYADLLRTPVVIDREKVAASLDKLAAGLLALAASEQAGAGEHTHKKAAYLGHGWVRCECGHEWQSVAGAWPP
jgi:hypothetical protein